ncbi:hypothetical protein ON010_g13832 [Phytophthora cinnamomi]|nr:hypothetical protein ON010_g13832 [Phytophthora cinnamomi]
MHTPGRTCDARIGPIGHHCIHTQPNDTLPYLNIHKVHSNQLLHRLCNQPELEFAAVLSKELVDGSSLREDDDCQAQFCKRNPHQHVGRQRHAPRAAPEGQSAAAHERGSHQNAADRQQWNYDTQLVRAKVEAVDAKRHARDQVHAVEDEEPRAREEFRAAFAHDADRFLMERSANDTQCTAQTFGGSSEEEDAPPATCCTTICIHAFRRCGNVGLVERSRESLNRLALSHGQVGRKWWTSRRKYDAARCGYLAGATLKGELTRNDVGAADDVHLGAELGDLIVRQDVAAVEEEGGLGHVLVDLGVVERLELVPLGERGDGVRVLGGLVRVVVHLEQLPHERVTCGVHPLVLELVHHVLQLDLRVVHGHVGLLLQQVLDNRGGGGLAHIARVLLEGEAENTDLLVGHRVEHAADHGRGEAGLLVLVHGHDVAPVVGHLGQVEALGQVHQVQDVLLEARAAEAHRAIEELAADAVVGAHGARHFMDVSARGLAHGRDGVDARDALRQEGVGHELGQLRGPDVGRDDALARHPVRVDAHELLHGSVALGGLGAANQDAAGLLQVVDGRALGQELRVGQHLELEALRVGAQHGLDALGRAHGHRGLLHHDLALRGHVRDLARAGLAVLRVGGAAGADAARLGGRVHAHEDDVGLVDVLVQVGGEEQMGISSGAFHLAICFSDTSTTTTFTSGQLAAITAMVGPPT